MNILFLTNNPQFTKPLYDYLHAAEEKVTCRKLPLRADWFSPGGDLYETDFIISYGYVHLVSKDIVDLFEGRIINLHISLLPWNRGISPNFWSFYENTPKGVTIHQMNAGLDKGDILVQKELFMDAEKETFESSYNKLHQAIVQLFIDNWEAIKSGRIVPKAQEGIGSYHSRKQTDTLLSAYNINWSDNIARVVQ